ncbi:hypothetical protein NLI96_g1850 [Meripilus lineatus]|uniref:Uncharacterized protein n=1 Tax=Meripilus lineatus TaxID=2056292 RepID=A0AAD5VC43_9APHY|nr:hypothetical protein NLI96_g1850 [Physisporinus lineatus]
MSANISPTTSRPPRFSGPDIYESSTCHVFWAPNAPRTVHIRIKPEASDGDPSRWPDRTDKVVDVNGNVRFYVDADEKRTSDWKQKLGRVVWEQHVKPALQKDGNQELFAGQSFAKD